MAKTPAKRKNEATDGLSVRQKHEKHSYKMARTVRYNGILYERGQEIEFTDKNLEKRFLQNNYVI